MCWMVFKFFHSSLASQIDLNFQLSINSLFFNDFFFYIFFFTKQNLVVQKINCLLPLISVIFQLYLIFFIGNSDIIAYISQIGIYIRAEGDPFIENCLLLQKWFSTQIFFLGKKVYSHLESRFRSPTQ
jgi:hypothetical protein